MDKFMGQAQAAFARLVESTKGHATHAAHAAHTAHATHAASDGAHHDTHAPAAHGHDAHAHGHGHGHHDPWHELIHFGVFLTNATGAALLFAAIMLTMLNLVLLVLATITGLRGALFCPFDRKLNGGELSMATIRIQLGVLVCTSLQLLVIADVLDTMAKPLDELSFDMLGKLVLVVLVREGLAYLMDKEVQHLQHELHDHGHDDHAVEHKDAHKDTHKDTHAHAAAAAPTNKKHH
jgi:uncharacterized membrane protein